MVFKHYYTQKFRKLLLELYIIYSYYNIFLVYKSVGEHGRRVTLYNKTMIPLAYCTLWAEYKGQWKGLLYMDRYSTVERGIPNTYRDIMPVPTGISILFSKRLSAGTVERTSNWMLSFIVYRTRDLGQWRGQLACMFQYFFVFAMNLKWKTMAWDLGCVRKSSGVCIILLFGERPSWTVIYRRLCG